MNVLVWHVHGAWTTSFVHGRHRYLVPVDADRGPFGRGRARTYRWPDAAVEVTPDDLATTDVDVVVAQRQEELALARAWLRWLACRPASSGSLTCAPRAGSPRPAQSPAVQDIAALARVTARASWRRLTRRSENP